MTFIRVVKVVTVMIALVLLYLSAKDAVQNTGSGIFKVLPLYIYQSGIDFRFFDLFTVSDKV
jgi:hypothetical protein